MPAPGIVRLYRDGPPGHPLQPLKLDRADFQSDLPEQHWHVAYENADHGLTVGVWTTTDMQESFGPYPGDEFMILLEGDVAILDAEDRPTVAQAGEAFLVHNGSPVSWKQVGFCRKFFVIYDPPRARPEARHGVVVLDRGRLAAELEEADPTDRRTEFARRAATGFVSADSSMTSGLCDGQGADLSDHVTQSHKMIWLLSGQAELADGNGPAMSIAPGDVVFIPAGTACTWTCERETLFIHCTVDPAQAAP